VKFGSIDFTVLGAAVDKPLMLGAAFLCLLATIPISAMRWLLLLRALQFRFSGLWTLNTTFISMFFNTFLPGAYGGDLVRLAIAYRGAGGHLNHLTFSVIVDRLTGLLSLLLLGIAMVPALPPVYADRLEWLAGLALLGLVVGLVIAVRFGALFIGLALRIPAPVGPKVAHILTEILGALGAYLSQPLILIAAVAISIVQFALVLAALIIVGHAMGFVQLSWSGYVVAGVWSIIANALPITPGGIGVGEAAFAQAAFALSSPSTQNSGFGTVFLATRILTLLVSLIGLLPWLFYRTDLQSGLVAIKKSESTG